MPAARAALALSLGAEGLVAPSSSVLSVGTGRAALLINAFSARVIVFGAGSRQRSSPFLGKR